MRKLIILMTFVSFIFAQNIDSKIAKKISVLEKDKVYIVDFFASWCKSCEKELPLINKLVLDKSKYEIIGIDMDEDFLAGQNFVKNLKLTFRIIDDTNQKLVEYFQPEGVPAIYYIKNQKIIGARFGAKSNIGEVIKKDLKEYE